MGVLGVPGNPLSIRQYKSPEQKPKNQPEESAPRQKPEKELFAALPSTDQPIEFESISKPADSAKKQQLKERIQKELKLTRQYEKWAAGKGDAYRAVLLQAKVLYQRSLDLLERPDLSQEELNAAVGNYAVAKQHFGKLREISRKDRLAERVRSQISGRLTRQIAAIRIKLYQIDPIAMGAMSGDKLVKSLYENVYLKLVKISQDIADGGDIGKAVEEINQVLKQSEGVLVKYDNLNSAAKAVEFVGQCRSFMSEDANLKKLGDRIIELGGRFKDLNDAELKEFMEKTTAFNAYLAAVSPQLKKQLALKLIDQLKIDLSVTRLEHNATMSRKATSGGVQTELALNKLIEKLELIKLRIYNGETVDLAELEAIRSDPAAGKALESIEFDQKAALFSLSMLIMVVSGGVAAGAGSFAGGIIGSLGRSAVVNGLRSIVTFSANSAAFTAASRSLNQYLLGQAPQEGFVTEWLGSIPGFAGAGAAARLWEKAISSTQTAAKMALLASKGMTNLTKGEKALLSSYAAVKVVGGAALEAGVFTGLSGDFSGKNFAEQLAMVAGMKMTGGLNQRLERSGEALGKGIVKAAKDTLKRAGDLRAPSPQLEGGFIDGQISIKRHVPAGIGVAGSRVGEDGGTFIQRKSNGTPSPIGVRTGIGGEAQGVKESHTTGSVSLNQKSKLLDPASMKEIGFYIRSLRDGLKGSGREKQIAIKEELKQTLSRINEIADRRTELIKKYGEKVPLCDADAADLTLKEWDKLSAVSQNNMLKMLGISYGGKNIGRMELAEILLNSTGSLVGQVDNFKASSTFISHLNRIKVLREDVRSSGENMTLMERFVSASLQRIRSEKDGLLEIPVIEKQSEISTASGVKEKSSSGNKTLDNEKGPSLLGKAKKGLVHWAESGTKQPSAGLGMMGAGDAGMARYELVKALKWAVRKLLSDPRKQIASSKVDGFEFTFTRAKKTGNIEIFVNRKKIAEISALEREKHIVVNGKDYTVSQTGDGVEISRPPQHLRPFFQDANKAIKILREEGKGKSIASGDAIERPLAKVGSADKPGALLEINPNKKVIIIGDLHGNTGNLQSIIKEYGEQLRKGEVVIVILGDAVHKEHGGPIDLIDMASSIEILDYIIQLKNEYPDNFHYIKGNHDTFTGISKGGFKQGDLHREQLVEERGEQYASKIQALWDASPLAVRIGDSVFAAHSAVIKGGASPQEITNAKNNKKIEGQLLWNRPNENYSRDDVESTRKGMGLRPDGLLISGHTPNHTSSSYEAAGMPGSWFIHGSYDNSKIPLQVFEINQGRVSLTTFRSDGTTETKSVSQGKSTAVQSNPAPAQVKHKTSGKIIQENVGFFSGKSFKNAAMNESISGNAGSNHLAVNIVVDIQTGRFVECTNDGRANFTVRMHVFTGEISVARSMSGWPESTKQAITEAIAEYNQNLKKN